jgi:hypothetical protein
MARSARESAPAGVKRNKWLLVSPRTVMAAASLGSPEAGVNEPMPPRAARLTWANGLNEPVTALLTVGAMTRPAATHVAAISGARSARQHGTAHALRVRLVAAPAAHGPACFLSLFVANHVIRHAIRLSGKATQT